MWWSTVPVPFTLLLTECTVMLPLGCTEVHYWVFYSFCFVFCKALTVTVLQLLGNKGQQYHSLLLWSGINFTKNISNPKQFLFSEYNISSHLNLISVLVWQGVPKGKLSLKVRRNIIIVMILEFWFILEGLLTGEKDERDLFLFRFILCANYSPV